MRLRYVALLLLVTMAPASAQRLLVPDEYPTIQAAIDAATPGDTVLVDDGTYVENLTFRGKDIVVASYFALDGDPDHVEATVIDGSGSADPDTASVVLFIEGETRAAVLEGFTLTGGTGTRWIDEHGAGIYQEGGAVLVAFSSPTIRHNRMVGNEAVRRCTGCVSAGGGAVRVGDGDPLIEHNVIAENAGMYGGGVVLNYTSGTLRNNVIVRNRVYQAATGAPTFGGGGIWISGDPPSGTDGNVIENNIIVENAVETAAGGGSLAGRGGGILIGFADAVIRNNILWGNTQVSGGNFADLGGNTLSLLYNDVQGGTTSGTGNIEADPAFADAAFHLTPTSPAVDAGDPDPAFNDPEDPNNPGMARYPALGTVRSDMGAYGGPGAADLAAIPTAAEPPPAPGDAGAARAYPSPTRGAATLEVTAPAGPVALAVYDVTGRRVRTLVGAPHPGGPLRVAWGGRDEAGRPVPPGLYLLRLSAPAEAVARVTVVC
jgi:hypothetical protein